MDQEMRLRMRKHPKIRMFRIAVAVVVGLSFVSVFAAVFGWVVMFLWNWLMPSIFELRTITYWEAFGLTLLSKVLLSAHHGMPRPGRCQSDELHRKANERWHRWLGVEDSPLFQSHFSREDLKHYKNFWKDEGEKAFEEYLSKIRTSEEHETKGTKSLSH